MDILIVLVGRKCDMRKERQVTAKQIDEFNYFETSAKQRVNVDEAFFNLVRLIRRKVTKNWQKKQPKYVCFVL